MDFEAEEEEIIAEDENLRPILLNTNELDFHLNDEEEILLGRGAFGKVVKGSYRNHAVAIKVMSRNGGDVDIDTEEGDIEEDLGRFRQECVFMKELKHENIVMLIGAVWSEELICCVIEYCEGGDLDKVLTGERNLTWEDEKVEYAINISSGMQYLHNCVFFDDKTKSYVEGVVHRDLKPENILLTSSGVAKISDMGESRVVSTDGNMTSVGTRFFMAPEVALGELYDQSCDVFSFGMMLAEMCQLGDVEELMKTALLKKAPKSLQSSRNRLLNQLVRKRMRPVFADTKKFKISDTPEVIYALMERCWGHDARLRPSFGDILNELNGLKADLLASVVGVGRGTQDAGRGTQDVTELERLKKEHMEAEERRINELEVESRKAQEKLRERMKRVAALREKKVEAASGENKKSANDVDDDLTDSGQKQELTQRMKGQEGDIEEVQELRRCLEEQALEIDVLRRENARLKLKQA